MPFITVGALAIALLVLIPAIAHMLQRGGKDPVEFSLARLVQPTAKISSRRGHFDDWLLFALRASMVVGLALLGAMSMSYLVPTRPVWNHLDTSASFYTGAFQLGWAVSATLLFVHVQRIEAAPLVLIACGLIVLTLLRIYIILRVVERLRGLNVYRDQPYSWLTGRIRQIRIVLAVVGGVVTPLFSVAVMFLPETFSATVTEGIWILAVLLLFLGEGMDRWVFFEASPSVIFPPRF